MPSTSAAAPEPLPQATRQGRSRLARVTSSKDAPAVQPVSNSAAAVGSAQQGRPSRRSAQTVQDQAEETQPKAQSESRDNQGAAADDADADSTAEADAQTGRRESRKGQQQGGAGLLAERGSRSIEELAVRFSQATKELQVDQQCICARLDLASGCVQACAFSQQITTLSKYVSKLVCVNAPRHVKRVYIQTWIRPGLDCLTL